MLSLVTAPSSLVSIEASSACSRSQSRLTDSSPAYLPSAKAPRLLAPKAARRRKESRQAELSVRLRGRGMDTDAPMAARGERPAGPRLPGRGAPFFQQARIGRCENESAADAIVSAAGSRSILGRAASMDLLEYVPYRCGSIAQRGHFYPRPAPCSRCPPPARA